MNEQLGRPRLIAFGRTLLAAAVSVDGHAGPAGVSARRQFETRCGRFVKDEGGRRPSA